MVSLYPYQTEGAEWLAAQPYAAGLFDDTGLGKTATTIRAAQLCHAYNILVLAPSIVLWNWVLEFRQWWPAQGHAAQVIDSERSTLTAFEGLCGVVVCTHGLILCDAVASQLRAIKWHVLVVDEAHNFRGHTAKRTHVLYPLPRSEAPALAQVAERVWLLTATPVPNNCSELWTHLRGLWPEALTNDAGHSMSWQGFVHQFCRVRRTRYGLQVLGNKNVAGLRALLRGKFLRRLKKDVLHDFPSIRFEVVTLTQAKLPWELTEVELRIKPKILAALQDTHGNPRDVGAAWAALRRDEDGARFRKLCGLAKVEPLAELLRDELKTNAVGKLGIFAHHVDVVEALAAALAEFGVVTITGATSAQDRTERIAQFQTDANTRVFVGNIVAAGTGATLTAASEVVFCEMSYTPGNNRQAADRFHRIGQTEKVRVRFFALAHTADEDITRALRNKTRAIREVLK